MVTTVQDPLVGRLVDGRYQVLSRIARGGMATVYLATDARLERPVALKVMHPHLAEDATFVERFTREARSAARLSHPGVVSVYDQGAGDGAVYLAMELVPGRTLRDVLAERGALSAGDALDAVDAVLDALAAAHDAGIVHRDVKPENVLVGDDGRVRVADFGLARAASSTGGTTASTLIGTVGYLAPELVLHGTADARADVYAVGVMLFELLTGRAPFAGGVPVQVAFRHVQEDVPPPSSIQPSVPADVDDLVLWSTARDPSRRPADAGQLLAELREVRAGTDRAALAHQPAPVAAARPGAAAGATAAATAAGAAPPVTDGTTRRVRREHVLELPVGEALEHEVARVDQEGADAAGAGATAVLARTGDVVDLREGRDAGPDRASGATPVERGAGDGEDGAGSTRVLRSRRSGGLRLPRPALPAQGRPEGRPAGATPSGAAAPGVGTPGAGGEGGAAHATGRRRPRRPLVLAVVAALTVLAVATGAWAVLAGPLARVAVPELANLSEERAVAALTERDLVAEVTETYSDAVEPGLVVSTDPDAGSSVPLESTVSVAVSLGPQLFAVPEVVGATREEAEGALAAAGVAVGAVEEVYSEDVAAGRVIAQGTAAGEQLRAASPVDLTVSRGRQPLDVPSVVGQPRAQAEAAVRDAGLAVGQVVQEPSETVPAGSVVRQDPADGTRFRGDPVALVVSSGPPLVTVPDVVGQQLPAAQQALEAAGVRVEVERVLGGFFGTVRSQEPPAGQVQRGSTVRLTVV